MLTGAQLALIREGYEYATDRAFLHAVTAWGINALRQAAERGKGDSKVTAEGRKTAPRLRVNSHGLTQNART